VQGVHYYGQSEHKDSAGLMHEQMKGYGVNDLKVVAAFDIDSRKVEKDVSEAIFAPPNCTKVFCPDVPEYGVKVQMGPTLDGVASHMKQWGENRAFRVADTESCDVAEVLKDSGANVVVNYLPVGSEEATRFYAEAAIKAGCGFVNCIPVFIASDDKWASKFTKAGLPIVGDDIKAQVGATITHRVLTRLFRDRGVVLEKTYQLNTGGNTDFLNMLERSRLKTKKVSKTDAVQSQLDVPMDADNIHIGPSDYVPWQNDNKVCFIRMEGRGFGDVPMNLELRLSVEDSPNSAGTAIDAIRACQIGLDRGLAGPLEAISAYTMKHPPLQLPDSEARERVEEFIDGRGGARVIPISTTKSKAV
jgi:myo-inositol-1-phosphate synthase